MTITVQVSSVETSISPSLDFQEFLNSHPGIDDSVILHSGPTNTVRTPFYNGLVGAAYAAYCSHHHLTITPDDVWIGITTAFARFIDTHGEEMRDLFVSHSGKISLEAHGSSLCGSLDSMMDQLAQQIKDNTKGNIKEWFEPNFSTTTDLTRTVGSMVLMGGMKSFFTYRCNLKCGLPSITLEGTVEDWKLIRSRADKILEYSNFSEDLTIWHTVLISVLNALVATVEGVPNREWWNRICSHKSGGSGPPFISGWIQVFIPFNEDGCLINRSTNIWYWKTETSKIPSSTVSVPVVIDDNGNEYNTNFIAGHIVCTKGDTEDSIRPCLGYVITKCK